MTVSQNNAGAEAYRQEQANRLAAERWTAVMGHPAAIGREKLATLLLSQTGDKAMLPGAIIAALEHAPDPNAAVPHDTGPAMQEQVEHFGNPKLRDVFDERLYAAGAAAAKWLLNK